MAAAVNATAASQNGHKSPEPAKAIATAADNSVPDTSIPEVQANGAGEATSPEKPSVLNKLGNFVTSAFSG